MHLLFLEIDGVLQSHMSSRHRRLVASFETTKKVPKLPALCPIIMGTLCAVLEGDLDIRLVLFDHPQVFNKTRFKQILKCFKDYGIPPEFIIDYRKNNEGILREVALWRTEFDAPDTEGESNWAIVAAEPVDIGSNESTEVLAPEMSRMILTNPMYGLRKEEAETLFDTLCGNSVTEITAVRYNQDEDDEDEDDDGEEVPD